MAGVSTATSLPLKSNKETNVAPSKAVKKAIIIRPARLSDLSILAHHNQQAYYNDAVNRFLAPRAHEHPEDQVRIFLQGIQKRYCNPSGVSLVACFASDPAFPLAYLQFNRVGTDAHAQDVVREKGVLGRLWLLVLSWVFWAWHAISNYVWKDRISDFQNIKKFGEYINEDRMNHWTQADRQNRWAASSLVVGPEYQGRGIGKLLMANVIERSEKEKVVIGLSASAHGEYLYRKLGFELMADFTHRIPGEQDLRGGIMIRYPEGWDGERHKRYVGYYDLHKDD